jgi:hypothetical protein
MIERYVVTTDGVPVAIVDDLETATERARERGGSVHTVDDPEAAPDEVTVPSSAAETALFELDHLIQRTGGPDAQHPGMPLAAAAHGIAHLRHVNDHAKREALQILEIVADERGVEINPDVDPLTDGVFQARDAFQTALEGRPRAVADGGHECPHCGRPLAREPRGWACHMCDIEYPLDDKGDPDLATDGGQDVRSEWTLVCTDCDFEDVIVADGHPRDGPPSEVEERVREHKGTVDWSHVVRVKGRFDDDPGIDPSLVTDGGQSQVDHEFDESLQELANDLQRRSERIETIRADYQHGRFDDDEARRQVARELEDGPEPNEVLQGGGA